MSATNIPIQLTSFIGREQETADLQRLLGSSRLVTLTGAGGCGKTRLALWLANKVKDDFADGVFWVEFAPVIDAVLVPQVVAKALRFSALTGDALIESLVEYLFDKRIFIVLDNCEHLLKACAALVGSLLQSPGVHLLITSREQLSVEGEALYPVSPLSLPPVNSKDVNLEQFDAIRLFAERARSVLPGFALTPENGETVAHICRCLDGIPLAIELASVRVNLLSVEQINARLDDRFALLTSRSRASTAHHRTLRATIDWSYELLSPQEQIMISRLAVFSAGCSIDAVESICVDEKMPREQILDLLASLVNKSLVVAEVLTQTQARYRMLETIWEYASEKLMAAGELDALRNRHLEHFTQQAENAAQKLHGKYQKLWLNWMETEHDNFRAALGWALEKQHIETGMRLLIALYEFWTTRGYVSEGLSWSVRILEQRDLHVPTMLRAHATAYASFLAAMVGDAPKAIAYGKEAVTLSETPGDDAKLIRAMAYGGVSGGARSAGDHITAYDYAGRAVSLLREMQEPIGLEMSLISQGSIAIALGNFENARTLLDEGLSLAEQAGDVFRIALALNYLGDLERCEGLYPRAQAMYEKSLARFQEIDAVSEVASILHNLAHTYLHQGKRERANELFKESMAMQQAQGNRQGITECLTGFAAIAISLDQPEWAARLLAASTLLGGENASSTWAAERMEYKKVLAEIRKRLTPEQFEAAQNEGKAMTLDQVIQKALSLVSETKLESDGLTDREREVAMMVGQGKSNGEIANELVLSKRTVEHHMANILSKLGFINRAQIVRWAVENGLTQASK